MSKDRLKRERTALYVDCILGSISAGTSLFALMFIILTEGIEEIQVNSTFMISLTFWIFWLIFSISILSYGIYRLHQEKNYEKWKAKMEKKKKKLEPPIL
ncbi:MAG: hypothetical protein ACFE92_18065 [Promethearchaeota archaeon]